VCNNFTSFSRIQRLEKIDVTKVLPTSAKVHTIMTGKAANVYVIVNALGTTALMKESAHASVTASVLQITNWTKTNVSVSVT